MFPSYQGCYVKETTSANRLLQAENSSFPSLGNMAIRQQYLTIKLRYMLYDYYTCIK